MKESLKSGLSFGTTSGIITTIGLIVGLGTGTHSMIAVIGGIVSLAVADGLSESMAMHVSQKTERRHPFLIRESVLSNLAAKFFVTMTFAVPFLFTGLSNAVIIDTIWGLFLLAALTYLISEYRGNKKIWDVMEHLLIAAVVILITYYCGILLSSLSL